METLYATDFISYDAFLLADLIEENKADPDFLNIQFSVVRHFYTCFEEL